MNAESAGEGKDVDVEAFCSLCLQLSSVGCMEVNISCGGKTMLDVSVEMQSLNPSDI